MNDQSGFSAPTLPLSHSLCAHPPSTLQFAQTLPPALLMSQANWKPGLTDHGWVSLSWLAETTGM